MVRRMMLAVALVALVVPASSSAVPAAGPVVIGGPGSWLTPTYTTPLVPVEVGGPLTYLHADAQRHNVVASNDYLSVEEAEVTQWCVAYQLNRCPIFWSPLIGLPSTEQAVFGLDNLEAGLIYQFTCSIHPNMIGQLLAVDPVG